MSLLIAHAVEISYQKQESMMQDSKGIPPANADSWLAHQSGPGSRL
jgi:hypothetical protein